MREKLLSYEKTYGLEGYTTANDFKEGEPYFPHPQRNEAFPRFPAKLTDPAEMAAINDYLAEVTQAVAKEPIVRLGELDIRAWQKRGGFSDEAINSLLESDDRRHRK
jgi:hypothetical protein